MTTKKETSKYTFTSDAIAALRDDAQNSWRSVADALGLGSPGAARRAYSEHVRPHTDSVLAGRASGGKVTPVDLAGLDVDAVREQIAGHTIVVQRKDSIEDITCAKVTSIKGDTINFNDGNKARSVKASAVVAVK